MLFAPRAEGGPPPAYGGAGSLEVHVSDKEIAFASSALRGVTLRVDRATGSVREDGPCTSEPCGSVAGILGILRLFSGPKLLLITQATELGQIHGEKVSRIDDILVLNLCTPSLLPDDVDHSIEGGAIPSGCLLDITPPTLKPAEERLETKVIRETLVLYRGANFYFGHWGYFMLNAKEQHAYSQHLMRLQSERAAAPRADSKTDSGAATTAQPLPNSAGGDDSTDNDGDVAGAFPYWKFRNEFVWNRRMNDPLVDQGLWRWVLPVMQGYVSISQATVGETDVLFTLISRRSRYRAGARYRRRGIDPEGRVANSVETEFTLETRSHEMSFTQVRGSIPIFWRQTASYLERKPQPSLTQPVEASYDACRKHLQRMVTEYGTGYLVNLIDQQGRELLVGGPFEQVLGYLQLPRIKYFAFDFHRECKGKRLEHVRRLVKDMAEAFTDMGFSHRIFKDDNVHENVKEQVGVIRTNCMDCLDRTNYVQSTFSRHVVEQQLRLLGVLQPEGSLEGEADGVFKMMWVSNGDALSRQYAGTDALKRDLTLNGRKSVMGTLSDGHNSLIRVFQHTFRDAYRQHCIDLQLAQSTLQAIREAEDQHNRERYEHVNNLTSRVIANAVGKITYPEEMFLSAWPMFQNDHDLRLETVFLLTDMGFFLVFCDFDQERTLSYVRIPLSAVRRVEGGHTTPNPSKPKKKHLALRIYLEEGTVATPVAVSLDGDEEAGAPDGSAGLCWQASEFNDYSCTLRPVRGGCDNEQVKTDDVVISQVLDSFYQLIRQKDVRFTVLERPSLDRMPLQLDQDEKTVLASFSRKLGFVRKNWKERWLVLRNDGILYYYKEQLGFDAAAALNAIDITAECIEVLDWEAVAQLHAVKWPTSANEGTGFALRMEHGRTFFFFVDSVELCHLWVHELHKFCTDRESLLRNRALTMASTQARVIMSSYVTKLGGVRKNWKLRFMKLFSDGRLEYFLDHRSCDKGPLASLLLGSGNMDLYDWQFLEAHQLVKWPSNVLSDSGFGVQIRLGRLFLFYCETAAVASEWLDAFHLLPGFSPRLAPLPATPAPQQGPQVVIEDADEAAAQVDVGASGDGGSADDVRVPAAATP